MRHSSLLHLSPPLLAYVLTWKLILRFPFSCIYRDIRRGIYFYSQKHDDRERRELQVIFFEKKDVSHWTSPFSVSIIVSVESYQSFFVFTGIVTPTGKILPNRDINMITITTAIEMFLVSSKTCTLLLRNFLVLSLETRYKSFYPLFQSDSLLWDKMQHICEVNVLLNSFQNVLAFLFVQWMTDSIINSASANSKRIFSQYFQHN